MATYASDGTPDGSASGDVNQGIQHIHDALVVDGNNDVITMPAGTFNWTTSVQLFKNFRLQGLSDVGSWNTTTVHGVGGGVGKFGQYVNWTTTSSATTATLWGIRFLFNNPNNTGYTTQLRGTARFNGTNGGFRFTRCSWEPENKGLASGQYPMLITDYVTGVIDHCMYDCPVDAIKATGWIELDMPAQPYFMGSNTPTSPVGTSATVTISNASPAVVTYTAHGLKDAQVVIFSTTGTLPAPLAVNTTYFVTVTGVNTFNLSLAPFAAKINTSTAGSGTHTVTPCNNKPQGGFYSYAYPIDFTASIDANDFITIEDCSIMHRPNALALGDGPPLINAGGGRVLMRYCNGWGGFDRHGYSESGGCASARLTVCYNNFFMQNFSNLQNAVGSKRNSRTGAHYSWNDRFMNWSDGTIAINFNFFRLGAQPGGQVVGAADGCCFFDQNCRGGLVTYTTSVPTSQTFVPYETTVTTGVTLPVASITVGSTANFPASGNIYVNTVANGTQAVSYGSKDATHFLGCGGGTGTVSAGAAVVGPLVFVVTPGGTGYAPGGTFAPVQFQLDGVSPGVPVDTRIGAVYFQGTSPGVAFFGTTVGLASNNQDLTLNQDITAATGGAANFPDSGDFTVVTVSNGSQTVHYTSKTATKFQGCSGGVGTILKGAAITSLTHGRSPFTLTGLGPLAQDKLTGFTLRVRSKMRPESEGCQVPQDSADISCGWIDTSSTASSVVVDCFGGHDGPTTMQTTDTWELRFIVNGHGFTGGGPHPLMTGARQADYPVSRCAYFVKNAAGQDQYWAQTASGIWNHNNKYVPNITSLNAGTGIVDSLYQVQDVHRFIQGGLNDAWPTGVQNQPTAPLRIGPDWDSGRFGGRKIDGTLNSPTIPASIPSTDPHWPVASTADLKGWPYPHPLVGAVITTKIIGLTLSDFGGVITGQSATGTLAIQNLGSGVVTVSGITNTLAAGIYTGTFSGTIAVGTTQNVTITFTPAAATTYNGTLTVTADTSPTTTSIAITGFGVQAATGSRGAIRKGLVVGHE